jgi:hypothetical protein
VGAVIASTGSAVSLALKISALCAPASPVMNDTTISASFTI